MKNSQKTLGFVEFVALMAMMMALTAMSIDAMLPALSQIGLDLGVTRPNDNQLIISLLFLGMAAGQMFYGPLSDSIGRKPTIYLGFGLFILGCLLSMFAVSFQMMLAGRVLQGLGVASPRVITIALVRDRFGGRQMARVMSFVMAVFILIPVVAPSFGQVILLVADWRVIFAVFLGLVLMVWVWLAWRQPETLAPERRVPFSIRRIGLAIREIVLNKTSFGYTVALGFVSGAFIGYLNSAQQVFQVQYGLGNLFSFYFALLAIALGGASIMNARLVLRFGMRALSFWALQGVMACSVIILIIAVLTAGQPSLLLLTIYFMLTFFGMGILMGNLNSMAMEPLAHIAGVGAAVVGSLSTFISLFLGTLVGQNYNGTVFPLVGGFALFSFIAFGIARWVETKTSVDQPAIP